MLDPCSIMIGETINYFIATKSVKIEYNIFIISILLRLERGLPSTGLGVGNPISWGWLVFASAVSFIVHQLTEPAFSDEFLYNWATAEPSKIYRLSLRVDLKPPKDRHFCIEQFSFKNTSIFCCLSKAFDLVFIDNIITSYYFNFAGISLIRLNHTLA